MQDRQTGRDIKAGYSTVDLDISQSAIFSDGSTRSIKLLAFKKGEVTKAIAVLFSDSRGARFGCIPVEGSSNVIWNMSDADFKSLPSEWNFMLNRVFVILASKKLSD